MRGCSSAAEEEDSSASRTLRDTGGLLLPGDTLCNAALLVRIISDLQLWRGANLFWLCHRTFFLTGPGESWNLTTLACAGLGTRGPTCRREMHTCPGRSWATRSPYTAREWWGLQEDQPAPAPAVTKKGCSGLTVVVTTCSGSSPTLKVTWG